MLIHNKDDIEFVTGFPCLLGHPVIYLDIICIYITMNKNNYILDNRSGCSTHG